MTPADIAALVRGLHADPFAVLGPHEAGHDLAVRALWPGAAAIDLVTPAGDVLAAMNRVHEAGLFEVILPQTTRDGIDYRLRVSEGGGRTLTLDDPYRYGPVLTAYDLHLFGEGTHVRGFDKLGARPITHGIRDGVHFAVWAPSARRVSVVGDFNGVGRPRPPDAGAQQRLLGNLPPGPAASASATSSRCSAPTGGPCSRPIRTAATSRRRRCTASIVWNSDGYAWGDEAWMAARARRRTGG